MADRTVEIAPGVLCHHYSEQAQVVYVGKQPALVAAGLLLAHQFPEPARSKRIVSRIIDADEDCGLPPALSRTVKGPFTQSALYRVLVALSQEGVRQLQARDTATACAWPFRVSASAAHGV